MQIMSLPSLGTRTASIRGENIDITGKAVCSGCGGETFEVAIFTGGSTEAICINGECRRFWPPVGKKYRKNAILQKAVAPGGNEPSHLVQKTEKKFNQTNWLKHKWVKRED